MSKPRVSVLIPCHNAGPYIGFALESILAQTWPEVEIIVVNDNSTDSSEQVLSSFVNRGVKVITSSFGQAARARNRAAREATGDYLKFFDADDLMSPGMLSNQVERLSKYPDCVASAKWGRFREANAADFTLNPESVWRDLPATNWLIESWRDARPMLQPGLFLLPRPLWERAGPWNEELSLIDDFEFYTRVITLADQVLFCSKATLFYRSCVAGSLSGRKSRSAVESAFQSLLLGTNHLLSQRDDESARLSCANMLQDFIYTYYPAHPDLRNIIKDRIHELGGSNLPPSGPPRFLLLAKAIGWKNSRLIQRWVGRA